MKNKNVYFVGYFQDIEAKMKFVDLVECKNKYFLESRAYEYRASNIIYYSDMLFKCIPEYQKNIPKKCDIFDKQLYRKDYRLYLSSKKMKASTVKKEKKVLIRYLIHQHLKKYQGTRALNIVNIYKTFKFISTRIKQRDKNLLEGIRRMRFREKFLRGLNYAKTTIKNLNLTSNDIFIVWGKESSANTLLVKYLEDRKINYFYAEYGEIPGTITLSKNGIFGELFSELSWKEFMQISISEEDKKYTLDILKEIKKNQISTKNYDSNMFFLMKYFWDNSIKLDSRKKIIYVNGSELHISGFYDGRWGVDREGKNPNKMLLDKVVNYFGDEYMIMYKEHPMTIKNNKFSQLNPSDFPSVNFLTGLSIHDILEISDIVISLPSKVVITSLLYNKKTFVLGEFTIPNSNKDMNYITSKIFSDISALFNLEESDINVINISFLEFVSRLIKEIVIIYDDVLFNKYDERIEKQKIEKILMKENRFA